PALAGGEGEARPAAQPARLRAIALALPRGATAHAHARARQQPRHRQLVGAVHVAAEEAVERAARDGRGGRLHVFRLEADVARAELAPQTAEQVGHAAPSARRLAQDQLERERGPLALLVVADRAVREV